MRPIFWLTTAALLTAVSYANARTLSPEEALARLSESGTSKNVPAKYKSASPFLAGTFNSDNGSPVVYLFSNQDSGFMFVSADDVAVPLLGYGDSDITAAELPPQLKWWLSEYAREMEAYKLQKPAFPGKLKKSSAIKGAEKGEGQSIGPLLSTTWNQMAPYNIYAPEQDGSHTPTGCVATAMAQIINYHKYPRQAHGMGSATCNGAELTRSLDVEFDWDNMLDSYSGDYTFDQSRAVAELMVTAGYAVNMSYAPEGSGAYDYNVPKALVENFDYGKSAWLYYRDFYELEDWEELLISQLANVGPLYYSGEALGDGENSGGGHAFVCDGYDGYGMFHFNWGWGGAYDGYFVIDALNPEGQGTGGFEGGYNTRQAIIGGITPQKAGLKHPQPQLALFYTDMIGKIDGRMLTVTTYLMNMTHLYVEYDIKVVFENVDTGEKKEVYFKDPFTCDPYRGYIEFRLGCPELANGVYKVYPMTRVPGYTEWMPILTTGMNIDYVTLAVADGNLSVLQETSDVEIVDAELGGNVYENHKGCYTLAMHNPTVRDRWVNAAFALVDEEAIIHAESAPVKTKVDAGEDVCKDVIFELTCYDSFAIGEIYEAVLYDPDTMKALYYIGDISVLPESEWNPVLECRTFEVAGDTSNVNPMEISFNIEVRSTADGIMDYVIVELVKDGTEKTVYGTTSPLWMPLNDWVDFSTSFRYADAEEGQIYNAYLYDSLWNMLAGPKPFRINGTTGIESVENEGALHYDIVAGTVSIEANSNISSVGVSDFMGCPLNIPVEISDNTAKLDLTGQKDMMIINVRFADGRMSSMKLSSSR